MISRMSEHRGLACRWADLALLGITVNLAVLVAAPILRPDLNLLERSLSYYAVGPWGVVQAAAFVALGIASLALAAALPRSGFDSAWLRLSGLLIVIAGVASLGLVVYPMGAPGPATFLGDAHQTAGTIAGVAQLAATLAFALAIRADPVWGGLFRIAGLAFIAAVVGAILSQAAIWWPERGIPMGATMRLLAIPLVLFWGVVALRLRQRCARTVSRSAAAR